MKVLCSVHDTCSGVWSDPFTTTNKGSAVRSFSDAVNKEGSDLYAHPEHFNLYYLCDFDPSIGAVDVQGVPEVLMRAIDAKNGEFPI